MHLQQNTFSRSTIWQKVELLKPELKRPAGLSVRQSKTNLVLDTKSSWTEAAQSNQFQIIQVSHLMMMKVCKFCGPGPSGQGGQVQWTRTRWTDSVDQDQVDWSRTWWTGSVDQYVKRFPGNISYLWIKMTLFRTRTWEVKKVKFIWILFQTKRECSCSFYHVSNVSYLTFCTFYCRREEQLLPGTIPCSEPEPGHCYTLPCCEPAAHTEQNQTCGS